MDSLIDGLKTGNVEIRKQAIERVVNSPGDEMFWDKEKIMFHGESCRFDRLPDETVCAEQGMWNE